MTINSLLLKEAIADAKAKRQTELAWCKCVEGCMCEHCKPMKIRLAIAQAKEELKETFSTSFEERFLAELASGKHQMRNQTHTLTEANLDAIIAELEKDL